MLGRRQAIGVLGGLALAAAWSGAGVRAAGFEAGPAAPRQAAYAGLTRGATFVSGGKTYALLPEARAVHTGAGAADAAAPQREVIETRGPYVIYRERRPAFQSPRATLLEESTGAAPVTSHAVAINVRTGRAGIVLGTLIVKLSDLARVDGIAAAHGLKLVHRFDALHLAFYAAAPGADLVALADAVRGEPGVVSADLEVLENVRTPR